MKQFKNILVVAPLDKQLIAQATDLLKSQQSKVTLFAVAPLLDDNRIETSSGKEVDLQKLLENDLRQELNEQADALKDQEFRVKTAVASGHPFIEVIRQVVAKKHDLVLMLADGVSNLRAQLFGTLSLHLMRKCPCPVWVLKPTRRRNLRNVFAAVDPDPGNPIRDKLNVEILKRSITIAQNHNARLHVVHAWNTLGGELNRGKRWMTKSDIRFYIEKEAESHRKRLNQLLDAKTDGSAIIHMLQGRPGTVIPETVAELKGDLLVMGTVSRTGIPGFFIGNTAEMILSQVDCSVLTVKPEGFVTPIKLT
jgi:nucleotide-binding universal stress UspA family protein